jgi:hypothetical protein
MASYAQYTKCIEPADYIQMNRWIFMSIQSLLAGGTGLAIAIAEHSHWWCYLIVAEITALAFVISYCRHFLYYRLICLGGDRDVIAMLVSVEPASQRDWYDMDTDYTINLLPCDNLPGVKQDVAQERAPYGYLIKSQPGPESRGLPTPGETAKDKVTGTESAVLHAEFEGGGISDMLLGAEIAFFAAVAALAACILLPPWVAAILAALAFLILLIATIFGRLDSGSPSDVAGAPGQFHTNDDPGPGGHGSGADILYVQGSWVYDSVHDGWNEFHPVKVCTKIGTWEGDWSGQCSSGVILRVRGAFDDADSDETRDNQTRPEHQWEVHPYVDGCQPEIVIT